MKVTSRALGCLAALFASVAAFGCAKSLDSLSPFPCASDSTCPGGFDCNAQNQCVPTISCRTYVNEAGAPLVDGTDCNGVCTSTLTDPMNCGYCGHQCMGGGSCCDGQCADTTSDSYNCGVCGKVCPGGGACSDSTCACIPPLTVCELSTLATPSAPKGIAVDSTSVYYVDDGTLSTGAGGSIMRVPLGGGTPTTLVANQQNPWQIATSGGYLYWLGFEESAYATWSAALYRSTTSGAGAAAIATAAFPYESHLLVNGATVYFTVYNSPDAGGLGDVLSVPAAGGTTSTVASGQASPQLLAKGENGILWSNGGTAADNFENGSIATYITAYGAPETLESNLYDVAGLAADSSRMYFTEPGLAGNILSAAQTGGAVTTLASGQAAPFSVVLDPTNQYLYWTNLTVPGSVVRMPVSGGEPQTLASGLANPIWPVVDSTSVYWVNLGDGGVGTASIQKFQFQ